MLPRGVRNNNPLNIELGDPWRGLAPQQTDGRFAQFSSPEYGFRAATKVLSTYQNKHGLTTPRQMISRWAPAGENNVDAYVSAVSSRSGLDPDSPVDLSRDGFRLLEAMTLHENGVQPFNRETIQRGIQMAGLETSGGNADLLAAAKAELAKREQLAAAKAELTRREAAAPSQLEAFGRGALQGVTMATSDELYALSADPTVEQAYAKAREFMDQGYSEEDAGRMAAEWRQKGYEEQLAAVRGANAEAQEEFPATYMGGEVTGAVGAALTPAGAISRAANLGKAVTTIGKVANAAGKVGANAVSAGYQGLAYGYGAGEGGVRERMRESAETGIVSAGFGAAVPLFGRAIATIARGVGGSKAAKAFRDAAPAIDDLKSAASNLFQQAEQSGLQLGQQTMEDLAYSVWRRAAEMGLRKKLHPGAQAVLEELRDSASGPAKMSDLIQLRRVLQMGANDINNKDNARLVGAVVQMFDDYLLKLKPKDFMAGGPSKQALADWTAARDLWRRSIKAQTIEDAFEKAADQGSGLENGLRIQFRTILNNKRLNKMFDDEELDAMRQVVRGTASGNTLRKLSKFGFGLNGERNFLGGSVGVGAGAAVGGPFGAAVVPALGYAAAKGADAATRKGAETVRAMAATGQAPAVPRITSNAVERWLLPMISGTAAVAQ